MPAEWTREITANFAALESLLADLEAGRPCPASPELRALAEKVVAHRALHPQKELNEEELQAWARRMAYLITEGDDV